MICPSSSSNDAYFDVPAEGEGPVEVLLRLASSARAFRSVDGRLYARVPVGDRHEIYGIKSEQLRDWLIDGYRVDCGALATNWAINRVLASLEARARFDGGTPPVFIRVGRHGSGNDSSYYLDLGDPSGRAVKIGADGWSVVDRPGVHFRRPEGLLPLPGPSRDGSIEPLRSYVNLTESDFRLLIGWLAAALRPIGPYPVLTIYGEQGSAKSTLARVVQMLIDPQAFSLLAEPGSLRDLMVIAVNGWLLAFDNISVVPDWLSDGLCRLSTGGSFAARALYSNDDRRIIHARRPVILNGIEDFVRRGDLADRGVFLHLRPIDPTQRLTEQEFWELFNQDYPRIFGGVLDAVVGGLRELPSIRLREVPRMAEYASFGEAVGRGLGWPAESFLSAYNDNRWDATIAALEDSLMAGTLLRLIGPVVKQWSGTITKLQTALTQIVGKKTAASARWPKTSSTLGNELRRIAPQLRMHGLSINFEKNREGRLVTLTTAHVRIIQAPHVTSNPIESSPEQPGSD